MIPAAEQLKQEKQIISKPIAVNSKKLNKCFKEKQNVVVPSMTADWFSFDEIA